MASTVFAGTGLEVWEVVQAFKACGENLEKLKQAFDCLSPKQLPRCPELLLLYPEEVEEEIQKQEEAKRNGPSFSPPFP